MSMTVSDVMTPECTYCLSSDTVDKAARVMARHDIGFVPIADGDKLIGTLTDRDIVVRGIADGHDVGATPVTALMTDQVYYCFDDQDCADVAANMADIQVRRLPVVDRDKRLIGTVSLGDLARNDAEEPAREALTGISQES